MFNYIVKQDTALIEPVSPIKILQVLCFINAQRNTLLAYVFYRNQCVCVIHTYL